MDGKNAKIIELSPRSWPNSLALDIENMEILYIDARSDQLFIMDYDGKNHRTFAKPLLNHMKHPFALEYHPETEIVFWNDWRANGLLAANLDRKKYGLDSINIYQDTNTALGLVTNSKAKQPNDTGLTNLCSHLDCKESELCVFVPGDNMIEAKCFS